MAKTCQNREALVYRALYFGIAGAVTLRILIISVGYSLVNTGVYLVKLVFGSLLIYSGWKSPGTLIFETNERDAFASLLHVSKYLQTGD